MRPVPVLEQYQQIKRAHPEAIVLFRLGDFFETFGEDAERAAPVLGVTLTARELGKGHRLPMAGVPYHAFEPYVAKLLRAGMRVAVCDQLEEASGRGLVRREVVRVLTPGMVVEEAFLDGGRSNYAVAVCLKPHHFGLAALDCSTGELGLIRIDATDDALRTELARLRPAEVVTSEDDRDRLDSLLDGLPATWSSRADFDARSAQDKLRALLGVETLAAFGCDEWPEALAAAGALLKHAERARIRLDPNLLRLHAEHPDSAMHLDPVTRRALGLSGRSELTAEEDLFAFLDVTVTALGARRLRRWLDRPLRDRPALEARLRRVGALAADNLGRERLRTELKSLRDMERLLNRAGQAMATPRDLDGLRRTLQALPGVAEAATRVLRPGWSGPAPVLLELAGTLERALVEEPPGQLREAGAFRPGFDAELDNIREGSAAAREWIAALEARERERTGIRSLRVGFNQVFGYYLEVSHANREPLPQDYQRKQTLVNAERYVTAELKQQEALVLNARAAMLARENSLFRQLCQEVVGAGAAILEAADACAELDVLAALAELSVREGWTRPELDDQPGIDIHGGRHPLVERQLGPGRFTPNDVRLDPADAQLILLSGPNMAGKSTVLRQVALIVLLAQVGSFVPAESARLGICDRIFTRVGAHDELARGRSTFMVEMVETAHILTHATGRSLIIFDEVGRGTSTYDGVSIAQAILEYIHDAPHLRSLTLFATHFHELTALAERLPRLRNFRMEVREEGESVVFLHQVVPGGADRSFGIHVAQLAGLPRQVVVRSRQILAALEGQRPLERPAASAQLSLALQPGLVDELLQLDLDRLSPREALDKLFAWQAAHARA
jgi:DNA mismatch repair protein MutS